MRSDLSSICFYAKDKIPITELSKQNYVSTDNLRSNKEGIDDASSLPKVTQTQGYKKGDTLVSNIRPYFKKIWYAKNDGGCSNDVCVFRAKEGVDPLFLYYVLADDSFFSYVTATSKGTKMPRGDKAAIMKYDVPIFDIRTQRKIAKILGNLDCKIELNTKINQNLEEQAKALFKAWFIDFIPFGGQIPDDWGTIFLSDIAEFIGGYSYKGSELIESNTAMASIKNFDRNGGFKLDGYKEIVPSDKIKKCQYADIFDILVAHTDLTQNADVIGNAELVLSKSGYQDIIFSMDLVKVISKNKNISNFLIASILKDERFKAHCLGYINGTTVLHLNKKALPEYSLAFPNDAFVLKPLDEALTCLYKVISQNIEEIRQLEMLRNTLLPKLMSGELDVSDIDV